MLILLPCGRIIIRHKSSDRCQIQNIYVFRPPVPLSANVTGSAGPGDGGGAALEGGLGERRRLEQHRSEGLRRAAAATTAAAAVGGLGARRRACGLRGGAAPAASPPSLGRMCQQFMYDLTWMNHTIMGGEPLTSTGTWIWYHLYINELAYEQNKLLDVFVADLADCYPSVSHDCTTGMLRRWHFPDNVVKLWLACPEGVNL